MERIYIPKPGTKVKLKSWDDYRHIDPVIISHDQSVMRTIEEVSASRRAGLLTEVQSKELEEKTIAELRADHAEYEKTHDLPGMWAWFDVVEAGASTCRLRHTSRAVNAPDPAWEGEVETAKIEPPLGWKPVYEIVCKDKEQADKVITSWFALGIHVWSSHDLSSGGRVSFTPFGAGVDGFKPQSPHWQYTAEPTESIPASLCREVFIVKVFEEWEPKLPETEKLRKAELKRLRKEGVRVEYIKGEHMWVASRETTIYQLEEV